MLLVARLFPGLNFSGCFFIRPPSLRITSRAAHGRSNSSYLIPLLRRRRLQLLLTCCR